MQNRDIDWRGIFSFSSVTYTTLGIASAFLALKGFMMPNHFLDGGVTGLSILAYELTHINIGLFLILFNLPFVYLSLRKFGATFAVHSLIAVILLAILMTYVSVPVVTSDKILIAIFGGFFIGLGIGLVIRAGCMIDGLEVIAEYTNEKSGFSTSEIIIAINTLIFLTAAIEFGVETAMYSILTYFAATRTIDYVVDGLEQYTALTVVSQEYETVKAIIVKDFGKAITIYKGERGYLPGAYGESTDCDIVMAIATRLEIHQIKRAILEKDPKAFIYVNVIKEVKGGIVKKVREH
ncbi:MAG: YitT family protein [Candidatus Promineifilaceae bacterium]